MSYTLDSLLIKMGAPEVRVEKRVHWHYFDKAQKDIAGFAEIRLEEGGARLVAELKHSRKNHEDDAGNIHALFTESFYLCAERVGKNKYEVRKICLDSTVYDDPQKSVIELGLSIFHARALDISILMVEQVFNRQDILDRLDDFLALPEPANRILQELAQPQALPSAMIIPFPKAKIAVRQR